MQLTRIDEANNACFIIRDNDAQALGYVYFEDEPGHCSKGQFNEPEELVEDEAVPNSSQSHHKNNHNRRKRVTICRHGRACSCPDPAQSLIAPSKQASDKKVRDEGS